MNLNVGAGADIRDDCVNVDRVPLPGIDVVCDLDDKWPFDDDTADMVLAFDIFEHVRDAVHFMAEIHRILVPGGLLYLQTSHWKEQTAYTDPTHVRFPTEETFDFWIPGTHLYKYQNAQFGGIAFTRQAHWIERGLQRIRLVKA